MANVFVGHDWAEIHHDIYIEDPDGKRIARARVPDGIEGTTRLHELLAETGAEPDEVIVATETDRGLFVGAMVAAGYRVFAVNPMSVARYRERHSTSGAKSDPGDAYLLAEIARLDRHNHRPVAGDSTLADAVKALTRSHQSLVWTRQRQVNQLRSMLREFYPAAIVAFPKLHTPEALAVLAIAPTPTLGRALSKSKIAAALRRAGRKQRIDESALAIQTALRAEHLETPPVVGDAMGVAVAAFVAVIGELVSQTGRIEEQLADRFEQHPDAKIIRSLPGLGMILGARVLAEFGDDPNRYVDAKSRKNYAGTSPITRASGKHHVVLARYARNKHVANACYQWAFTSMLASPGARAFYDARRARGDTHNRATRALSNRWVGILHGCLEHGTLYDEHTAWAHRHDIAA
jgi:transposase